MAGCFKPEPIVGTCDDDRLAFVAGFGIGELAELMLYEAGEVTRWAGLYWYRNSREGENTYNDGMSIIPNRDLAFHAILPDGLGGQRVN